MSSTPTVGRVAITEFASVAEVATLLGRGESTVRG